MNVEGQKNWLYNNHVMSWYLWTSELVALSKTKKNVLAEKKKSELVEKKKAKDENKHISSNPKCN